MGREALHLGSSLGDILIAGPCAAESQQQVMQSARELEKRNITAMRACLWKPRTEPGFDGVGIQGVDWLVEASNETGLTMSTEVLIPEHVSQIAQKLDELSATNEMLLWLGSRNQNHMDQREIARRMVTEMPKNTRLMIKNQPWIDLRHTLGIVDHVLSQGFPKEKIIMCHRGYAVNKRENPRGYRNIPDHEEARAIKEGTGLRMVFDPSHVGGSRELVKEVIRDAMQWPFYDGMIVEVHPDPNTALTDKNQQLSLGEFDEMLALVRQNNVDHSNNNYGTL